MHPVSGANGRTPSALYQAPSDGAIPYHAFLRFLPRRTSAIASRAKLPAASGSAALLVSPVFTFPVFPVVGVVGVVGFDTVTFWSVIRIVLPFGYVLPFRVRLPSCASSNPIGLMVW